MQKIDDAEKYAVELMEMSKKENRILNDNIMKQCEADLENITRNNFV